MRILLLLLVLVAGQAWAATYYIDATRGSDGAAGTSEGAAWADLETKLEATALSAGDTVRLACDSTWTYSTSTIGWRDGVNGSAGNVITINSYTPTGVDCGGRKPKIEKYIDTVTGDWTWDGANSAWYMASGTTLTHASAVFFGSTLTAGTHIKKFISPNTAFSAAYQWSDNTSNSRIYVWTPGDGDNPVTYYGGVRVQSGALLSAFISGATSENSYVTWDGIEFANCGAAYALNTAPAATANISNVTFNNITVTNCALGILAYNGDATNNTQYVNVQNSSFYDIQVIGVKASEYASYVTVTNSYFNGCNEQWSLGGCIYLQGVGSVSTPDNNHAAYGNTIVNPAYGTGGNLYDGAGIYVEAGCKNCDAYRNYISGAHNCLQDNSGEANNDYWSNVCIGDKLIRISDADGNNRTDISVFNNSAYCGLDEHGGEYDAIACAYVEANFTASEVIDFKNNALVCKGCSNTASSDIGLFVGTVAAAQVTQTYNLFDGFRESGELGDGADITLGTGSIENSVNWVTATPVSAAGTRLSASSPLRSAGTNVGSLQDYGNRRFESKPSIGAWSVGSGDARATVTPR